MTTLQTLEMALKALGEIEWSNNSQWQSDRAKVAITALRTQIALEKKAENARGLGLNYEPTDEPVACVQDLDEVKRKHLVYEKGMDWKDPLYTSSQPAAQFAGSYGTIDESAAKRIATALGWEPKREWVGLTDEDVRLASKTVAEDGLGSEGCVDRFAYTIEAKLKEKNT